jgi:hypothetical protein
MKNVKSVALLSAVALLFTLSAFARDKNQHSINVFDSVKVGGTRLKPGDYKVEWQGSGPAVQVTFSQDGKTVATAPATLQTNDKQVTQDDIIIDTTSAHTNTLKELDFSHQKEALIFSQGGL